MTKNIKYFLERAAYYAENTPKGITVELYEGNLTKPGAFPFQRYTGGPEVIPVLANTVNDLRGMFTGFIRPAGAKIESSERVVFTDAPTSLQLHDGSTVDLDAFRAQILQDLRKEQEAEETREELERLRNAGTALEGVLMNVASSLLQRYNFMPPAVTPAPVMQGVNHSQVNADDLEKAFTILGQIFGAEGIIKMAARLQNEPQTVQLVKQFMQ